MCTSAAMRSDPSIAVVARDAWWRPCYARVVACSQMLRHGRSVSTFGPEASLHALGSIDRERMHVRRGPAQFLRLIGSFVDYDSAAPRIRTIVGEQIATILPSRTWRSGCVLLGRNVGTPASFTANVTGRSLVRWL